MQLVPESSFFKDDSRDVLLRAALLCFVRDGFGGVSMNQIAQQAKTSVQRLVYHFKKPEDLLIDLAQMWGESGRQVTLEHLAGLVEGGPVEKIIGICDGMFLWMKKYPNFAKLTPVIAQAVGKSKQIREFQRKTFETGLDRTTALVSMCPRFKKLSEAKRGELGLGVYCTIQGAGHLAIDTDQFDNLEIFRASATRSIRALLED